MSENPYQSPKTSLVSVRASTKDLLLLRRVVGIVMFLGGLAAITIGDALLSHYSAGQANMSLGATGAVTLVAGCILVVWSIALAVGLAPVPGRKKPR